jgi:SEC-C motif-containing protein
MALTGDNDAKEWIREDAFIALAFLTFDGRIPRGTMRDFLRQFEQDSVTPSDDAGWHGWMTAVALLGMDELSPRIHAAFEDGRIPEYIASERNYLQMLDRALRNPSDRSRFDDENVGYIADVVETLRSFPTEDDEFHRIAPIEQREPLWRSYDQGPMHNPVRHVGRNDPCPCGTGKKFKKCCMQREQAD